MKVKDLMFTNVIFVKIDTPLRELLKKFSTFHTFPLVPVVDDKDKLVGMVKLQNIIDVFLPYNPDIIRMSPFMDEFWEEDIFSVEIAPEMGQLIIVEDIMDHHAVSLKSNDSIEKAYQVLRMNKVQQLPVVDEENKLVGMIGIFDIVLHVFKERGVF
jgi:CBS domain-containing protein